MWPSRLPALACLLAVALLTAAPWARAHDEGHPSPAPTPAPTPSPGPTPAPTPAPPPDHNRDYYAYHKHQAGRDYFNHTRWGRMGWELFGDMTSKTCGDCTFAVNNVTFVLERLPGCDPYSCVGTLDLSTESLSDDGVNYMSFLGMAPGIFDDMFEVTHLDLSGQPLQNNAPNLFNDLANENNGDGVTVNLMNTLYNCVPPYDPCSKERERCWAGFPKITFQHSLLIDKDDICVYVNSCGYQNHMCSVWRNHAGMASLGGECRKYCQDFDISGKGITDLPQIPNGLVDGIENLEILKIDDAVVLKPAKMFSMRNLMWRRLFVLKQDGNSWVFAGKAWFTIPDHTHKTVSMTSFTN